MKKSRSLLPLFLLFVIPMTGQVEHAPTPEQCRADADAWGIPKSSVFVPNEHQFSILTGAMMHDRTVTAETLEARIAEFGQCEKTDNVQAGRYAQASRAYAIGELGRMTDFMRRHNLTGQLYDEDEQGKR
jgi:hypothetical protein